MVSTGDSSDYVLTGWQLSAARISWVLATLLGLSLAFLSVNTFWDRTSGASTGFNYIVSEEAIRVRSVIPDSPAARAGLERDDIIVVVNGVPITEPTAYQFPTGDSGSSIELGIERSTVTGSTSSQLLTLTRETGWSSPFPILGAKLLGMDWRLSVPFYVILDVLFWLLCFGVSLLLWLRYQNRLALLFLSMAIPLVGLNFSTTINTVSSTTLGSILYDLHYFLLTTTALLSILLLPDGRFGASWVAYLAGVYALVQAIYLVTSLPFVLALSMTLLAYSIAVFTKIQQANQQGGVYRERVFAILPGIVIAFAAFVVWSAGTVLIPVRLIGSLLVWESIGQILLILLSVSLPISAARALLLKSRE